MIFVFVIQNKNIHEECMQKKSPCFVYKTYLFMKNACKNSKTKQKLYSAIQGNMNNGNLSDQLTRLAISETPQERVAFRWTIRDSIVHVPFVPLTIDNLKTFEEMEAYTQLVALYVKHQHGLEWWHDKYDQEPERQLMHYEIYAELMQVAEKHMPLCIPVHAPEPRHLIVTADRSPASDQQQ